MAIGGNWKEMFHAAEAGDVELVRYHLKMGIDPNYQHPEYLTAALLESIRLGHLAVAELLLEYGARPNIKRDFSKETPMSIAIESQNKAAIYLLNEHLPEEEKNKDIGPRNIILVTGGNRGIGRAIAKKLLQEGQKVVISARKKEEGESVVQALQAETGNPYIEFIQGDLSDIQRCNSFVEQVKTTHPDVNVLINNAGIWMMEPQLNPDGLEKSFMVNHIAPYILSTGLLDLLQKNQPARIVNVNAGLYVKGKVDPEKTPYGLDFSKIKTYANSKLCNVMFTLDFAEEIAGTGVTVNAVHPGVIKTGLGDSSHFLSKWVKFMKRFWKKPQYGAEAPSWLAIDPSLNDINGNYYNEKAEMAYADIAKDEATRKALRLKTEEILQQET